MWLTFLDDAVPLAREHDSSRQLANRGITFPVIFLGCEKAERGAIETAGCVAFFRKPFSAYL